MLPETLVTPEGLVRIQAELDQLIAERRPAIAARIKVARELGDLKENADYHDAKNEQSMVETRIQQLETRIRTARVITAEDASKVSIGTIVTVTDLETGDVDTWRITGAAEADPLAQRVSNESPIGSALIGAVVGDEVEVVLPFGTSRLRVDNIALS